MSFFRFPTSFLPHFALFIVNVIYSINYTVGKEVIPYHIKPFGMIVLRVVGAVILYWIVSLFTMKDKIRSVRDYLHLAVCGLFGVAINQLMFFKGLAITSPINASLIMTTIPIMVLIAAAVLLREMMTLKKIIGILLGIAGALLLLTMGKDLSLSTDTWRGDLFVWINATSYGIYLVIVKPLMKRYHPLTIIKWTFTFGMIFVIPVGLTDLQYVQWHEIPQSIWVAIVFIIIFVTFIAYLLNVYALKYVGSSVVGIYIYLQPVFASIIALYWAKDVVTMPMILFSILIFAGVYLVSDTKKGFLSF